MHIPDGYLSPQTTVAAFAVMVPLWSLAAYKVKNVLQHRQIPLIALLSAYSFVIMMFNIPVGASSVHAVGAVFIAILLGPWAACLAVSSALVIQAFVFGDGGILAIGANCFNMAVVMPFAGYFVYSLIAGKSCPSSKRNMIGACIGSYAGINLAALCAAVEFGIQPILFTGADGNPLYGYYPLSVSVPAMMFEHLLFAGLAEGILTAGAVKYIASFAPHLLARTGMTENKNTESFFRRYKIILFGVVVLALATPVGLAATGTAWGEWGTAELKEKIGFIPQGLKKLSEVWHAILPDYALPGFRGNFFDSALGYIASAFIGVLLIMIVTFAAFKLIMRGNKCEDGAQ